ncbi:hypothetical protein HYW83_02020 [Candidatus Peregrinibacteria bacterium]|nr:hypothetical protein [Candidatus Peregrinibacteria bacterium]
MKRVLIFVALALLSLPAFAADAMPTENPRNIAYGDEIVCDSLPAVWNRWAEKTFIRNKKTQRLFTKCAAGQMIMALREENKSNGEHVVKAGAYFIGVDEKQDFIIMERKSHSMDVLCDIQKTSNSDRIDYLCYNPTVAAGSVGGEEFSFRLKNRRTYRRDCTVFFSAGMENECGKWKRLK